MSSPKDGDIGLSSIADDPPHISDPTLDDDDDFLDTTGSPVPFFQGEDDEEDDDSLPDDTPSGFADARESQLNHLKKKKSSPSAMNTNSSQGGDRGPQGENTGRWTAEEHSLFLQGLEQHGKGWKKIGT